MESSESSSFDSYKPENLLNSISKQSPSPSDQKTRLRSKINPWSSKTPEKPSDPPRRVRHRGVALSLKDVKDAAQKLQKSGAVPTARPDPLMTSAKEHIPSWPESSRAESRKPQTSSNLPEKYEILDKFFSSFDSSIRLLRMKGSVTTFTKISPKIEYLTDRRFTYSHLAQLKFILPEAIELKKILMHDERTNCMKPELHIQLDVNAIEQNATLKSESGAVQLRKIFRSRLIEFFKTHPEGDDIPEEVLPEPFNQSRKAIDNNSLRNSDLSLLIEKTKAAPSDQLPSSASHLSRSFRRTFSRKVARNETAETMQDEIISGHTANLPVSVSQSQQLNHANRSYSLATSATKISSNLTSNVECSHDAASLAGLPLYLPLATPVKDKSSLKNVDPSSTETFDSQATLGQSISTPAKLMSSTPVIQPPKRCYMSPDDDGAHLPNKLVRRPSRRMALKFDTPKKNAKEEDDAEETCLSVTNDILDILPDNLVKSIREKERKALLQQDPAISQAKWRQQMISSLPKLFDMIYFLFQSIGRSVITKEELMHKIVSSHLHIVDRREVEEQVRLLQELVPEWIYEKWASTGDLLLCVNKIESPAVIRSRLGQAK